MSVRPRLPFLANESGKNLLMDHRNSALGLSQMQHYFAVVDITWFGYIQDERSEWLENYTPSGLPYGCFLAWCHQTHTFSSSLP